MRGKLNVGAALIALAFAVGVSTAAAIEWVPVPPEVKPAPWETWVEPPDHFSPANGHSFRLQIEGGYCIGREKPPKIDHVKIVERPKTKQRPFKSAVITVFEYIPEREEPLQTEEIREGHRVVAACLGIGGELREVLKLKRPLDHLTLYDGSYSPPKRIWPPAGG